MKSLFVFGLLALMVAVTRPVTAQGPISAVQDALKREQLYFGEPSGELDERTREALRLFQTRRGFAVTGELDGETLKALQGATKADPPPIESVPAGGAQAKVSDPVVASDREFLQTLETTTPAAETMPPPLPVAEQVVQEPPAPAPVSAEPPQAIPTPNPAPALLRAATTPAQPVVEKERTVTTEAPSPAREPVANDPWSSRKLEPLKKAPERRTTSKAPARSKVRIVEQPVAVEHYEDPIEPGGVRITRSTTTGRDGTVYIQERRTTTVPEVRRALPVERRVKKPGFRLFKDDDDDD